MADVESGFEDAAKAAILDNMEAKARQEIAPRLREAANQFLNDYGQRHDYDVGTLVAAAETEVQRDQDSVTVILRYPEPALLFERGTVDHVVEATNADVLSFIWEDPPEWVREEFEREGDGWRVFLPSVEVSGLPEGRFIRDALNAMRRDLGR